jgi:hypothetical protein
LLPGQDRLDDGWLQQGQSQQFVDRRVVQAFALGDIAAAGNDAVVEQLLPVERPGQRHLQWLLNVSARVPLCGLIANYNDIALPDGPDRLGLLTRTPLTKRIKMQGFIIFDDYGHRYGEFFTQMSEWLTNGQIKFKEDIVEGLENAPQAFIGLLEGKNFGKLIVQVAKD